MEAAVAEKEAEMTEWNDGRLDDLSKRVDEGFAEMRGEFRQVRGEIQEEFTAVNKKVDQVGQRLDSRLERLEGKIDEKFTTFHRMLFQASWGFALALIGVIGVIATKF